nr:PREDICTED: UNC93-like protein MFSD11 [Bemisia tabaci]
MFCNKRDFNLIYLGVCFLVLTMSTTAFVSIQEALLAGEGHEEVEGGESKKGYICLAIDYIILSLSLWLGPSILTVTGVKVALIIGSLGDVAYNAAFYFDDPLIIFPTCALNGLTHALLWTAQGTYLIDNSTPKTISRDTSVFWLVLCAAPIAGHLILFFLLDEKAKVDAETRLLIVHVLVGIAALAVFLFCFLRPPASEDPNAPPKKRSPGNNGFLEALVKSWKVFIDPDMLCLSPIFFFSGQVVAYNSVIFISSVGFTLNLAPGHSKQLVPMTGIFIGIGVIIGGVIQYVCKKKYEHKYERSLFLIAGTLATMVAFALTVLNMPDDSVYGDTSNVGSVFNSVPICLLSSVLMGIGQMYTLSNTTNLAAVIFRKESSQCSAVFNFVKFGAGGFSYYLPQCMGLHGQIGILAAFGIVGAILFLYVDCKVVAKLQEGKTSRVNPPEEQLEFMPKEHAATMIVMSSNSALHDLHA